MALQLRSAMENQVPPDYRSLSGAPRLCVRHPGYDDSNNTLIAFTATDGTADAPGVQHGLVHTACAIIAANRFDGWLSTARQRLPESRVAELHYADLLPVGNYYFHLPLDTCSPLPPALSLAPPYPIVPNFREWTFPQDTTAQRAMLPAMWKAPPITHHERPPEARARDVSCRLTAHVETTELAHIIPAAEKNWAGSNRMDTYRLGSRGGQDVVDGNENLILLRQDAHTQWDRRMFSIVPKKSGHDSWAWTLHVNVASQELHHLYHNRRLHALSGVRREFLFARFAWDLFPEIHGFLQCMVDRRLKVRDGSVRDCPGADCKQYCEGQGRNRSASPLKRKIKEMSSAPSNEAPADGETTSFDSGVSGFARDGSRSSKHESVRSVGVTRDWWPSQGREEDQFSSEQGEEEESGSEQGEDNGDLYGCQRRRRMQELEARLDDPDPFGRKRRREVYEASCEYEEYRFRGRKRTR